MADLTIPVLGMTCGGCVAGVQRALGRIPGVTGAVATLAPGQVEVRYDATAVDSARLVKGIQDAGFTVPEGWLTAQGGGAHPSSAGGA